MRWVIGCGSLFLLAGASQAQGLQIRVVDANTNKPVDGVMVERWASQWQPRVMRVPGKFWFPEKGIVTDTEGLVAINKTAWDDWYAIKPAKYEEGSVKRDMGKFRFTPMSGGDPMELTEESGIVVVRLRPSNTKPDTKPGDSKPGNSKPQ
jgi:hypothetical protein